MSKWLLLFSVVLGYYTEGYVPRDEYRELLDTVFNRLRLFKRDGFIKEKEYSSYETYNREDKDKSFNFRDDIKRRKPILSRYDKNHHPTTFNNNPKNVISRLVERKHGGKYFSNQKKFKEMRLEMPNVQPKEADTYMCYGHKLPTKDSYLIKFTPLAHQQIAHHMLLFGCEEPYRRKKPWTCREMQPVCKTGLQRIMYAWGKNAPALEMPKDVGIHVGGRSNINYLVVQVHYLNVSSFKEGHTDTSGITAMLSYIKPQYFAGIYMLAEGYHSIPAHRKKVHMDMACSYRDDDEYYSERLPNIYPFRFRVHTHKLGTVVTGYRVRDGKWKLIGKGDPQKPQAFYKVFNDVDLKDGDKIYARCTFNSTSRSSRTYIGATHKDEMCNFYIMYFYDSNIFHPPILPCGYVDIDNNKTKFPKDSDTPLIATRHQHFQPT